MSSKKKIHNTLLIVLLSLFALTSLATPAQANSADPVKPYNYVCTDNSGQDQDWNGKDPYTCVGAMKVFDANNWELINVKNGAKSDEYVDCSGQDENGMLTVFTKSEVLGNAVAKFVWNDGWIETFNCLST